MFRCLLLALLVAGGCAGSQSQTAKRTTPVAKTVRQHQPYYPLRHAPVEARTGDDGGAYGSQVHNQE